MTKKVNNNNNNNKETDLRNNKQTDKQEAKQNIWPAVFFILLILFRAHTTLCMPAYIYPVSSSTPIATLPSRGRLSARSGFSLLGIGENNCSQSSLQHKQSHKGHWNKI